MKINSVNNDEKTLIKGILLKGYGGFYFVHAQDRVWECSLRGRFRIRGQEFLPGDRVVILPGSDGSASIEEVEPRRNSLVRPAIANVDQAMLIFALTSPKPDFNLLDRLLIQVAEADIKPIIVFTKYDLWKKENDQDESFNIYEKIGYNIHEISSKTGKGIEALRNDIEGKVTVLAGPSGVGKSSLINALAPGLELKTGDVSRKLSRGRHTTRHVELLVCGGGLVADTPGFSSLNLPKIKREDLGWFFPEFEPFLGQCRFKSCLHDQEPDCAVKDAVKKGDISARRHENYLVFLQEVIADERRF